VTTTVPGIPAPTTVPAGERWSAIPRRWRVVLLAAAALMAIELSLSFVGGIAGSPPAGSQGSSSYGTSGTGLAAYGQLLSARGHSVVRMTRPLSSLDLPAGSTLMVVDPTGWTRGDTASVERLLRSGGHVVLTGPPPGDGLGGALFGAGALPRWTDRASGVARPVGGSPVTAGVDTVSSGGDGSFRTPGSAHPVLVGAHGTLAVTNASGTVVALASSAPLTNALLDQRDNAALGLNLARPGSAPVVFDEYDHGYGRAGRGLAGLPSWWRWGLGLALAAVLVWLVSAARRFGPVERPDRELIPARIVYADALASALSAVPPAQLLETVDPMQREARALLCRRSGLPAAVDDTVLVSAAHGAGVPDPVVASVVQRPTSGSDVLALGRSLAWLESHTGGSA
jgi:hypothetical protein